MFLVFYLVKWRSPGDWKCGKNNLGPHGGPGICNPTSHAPCCSRHGWCGSDKVVGKKDDWCKKGGTDFRLADDFPVYQGCFEDSKARIWPLSGSDPGKEIALGKDQNGNRPDL